MNRVLFFDFDGVFVDTFLLAVELFQKQYPDMTPEMLRTWFKGNVMEPIKEHGIDMDIFFEQYKKRLPSIPLHPGIQEVIQELSATFPIVIISSSLGTIVEDYLEQHELQKNISSVLGVEAADKKTDKFHTALKEHGAKKTDCLFVTDTLGDIKEAHEVGIASIAVPWGFHDAKLLVSGNPEYLAPIPASIPVFIESFFAKKNPRNSRE